MYTYCPHCHTSFRIHPDQLSQARGQVRCGVCNYCFNALENLTENLTSLPINRETDHPHREQIEPAEGVEQPAGPPAVMPEELPEAQFFHEDVEQAATAETHLAIPTSEEIIETEEVPIFTTEFGTEEEAPISESADLVPEPAVTASYPAEEILEEQMLTAAEADETTTAAEESVAGSIEPEAITTFEVPIENEEAITTTPVEVGGAISESSAAMPQEMVTAEPAIGEEAIAAAAEEEEAPVESRPEPAGVPLPDLGIIAAEPRPMAGREPAHWLKTTLWVVANIALIMVLAGQYTYNNRGELAQNPELRPLLTQFCRTINCDIPLRRDANRIALVSRVVKSHPEYANALLIDATLVNNANFPQPYPILELRFSDLNNQLLAGRRFQPQEYLKPGTPLKSGMAPHRPVHIVLEIVDPGKDAVSFQFELL